MIKDLHEVHNYSTYGNHIHDEFADPNLDPLMDIGSRVEHKYHYRSEESGLYHPTERSVVKIRNNGAVDVFAEEENGNRYDREEQVTNDFTNDRKIHIFSETEWVTQNSSSFVRGHRTMKTYGRTYVYGQKNVKMESRDDFEFYVFNEFNKNNIIFFEGNVNIQVNGNVEAQVKGNVDALVEGNVDTEVRGNVDALVKGNSTLLIEGNTSAEVKGSLDAKVGGSATIEASTIDMTSKGSTTIKAGGVLTLDGSKIMLG